MSLIVEDGTGLSDAESFISVDDADTYHDKRGNSVWDTITATEKEQALRRATDYMEQVYRLNWKGALLNSVQALGWPRQNAIKEDYYYVIYYPSDEVPTEVKNACAELALKAAAGELAPDLTQGIVREKVDVLEITYDQHSPQYVRYRSIDNMLAVLLMTGANSKKVVRV